MGGPMSAPDARLCKDARLRLHGWLWPDSRAWPWLDARLFLLALLLTSACAPRVPSTTSAGPDVDERLDRLDPQLVVTPLEAGQWALELEIPRAADGVANGAEVGAADAVALDAEARRIQWVSFVVYRPGVRRVDSLVRHELAIDTAGVRGSASPAVYAGVKWVQAGLVEGDEYVMMTIRTDRGVVVRSSPLFGELPLGVDSTRLELRLEVTGDSIALHARRRLPPARDEFFAGIEQMRIQLRDSSGAVVWTSGDGLSAPMPRPLLPDRVGDSVALRRAFRDVRMRSPVPPGRYTVVGTVDASPRPYFIYEEIRWGGRF